VYVLCDHWHFWHIIHYRMTCSLGYAGKSYELFDRSESPPPNSICFSKKYECTMSSESLTHAYICYISIWGVHSICFVLWRMHRSKAVWTRSALNCIKASVKTNICYCQYLVFITTYLGQLGHLQVKQKNTKHFGG